MNDASRVAPLVDIEWSLHPAGALEEQRAAWDALAAAHGDVPFLRSDFVLPAVQHFGSGRERLALGRAAGGVVAAAVLAPERVGVWQTFQPSQLPLGAVLCPGGDAAALARSLLRALPLPAVQLGLTQLDPAMFPRPADAETLDYIDTAWIDVGGDFEAYWAARGKNLRQNMAKQRRKLEADGTPVHLDVLTAPEEVAAGLRDYAALETAGWKAEGGTAIRLGTPQGDFYDAVLQAFARRGAARVYCCRLGDRVVAVDLAIESAAQQVVLKTTYDEAARALSPAFLMRQVALAAEWARLPPRVEFFGRRMEWHERWTDRVRTLYHLNVVRSKAVGWLRSVARGRAA
jgi:CelD/BcsL family acetyltransferase involved in cellulose biosynthesis